MTTNGSHAALAPYRVLDLTGEIGQFAGRCFAELGADVIKVEPPDGDAVRRIGPFVHDEPKPDRSLLWFTLNASKRGVTLDIQKPEGRDLLRKLIANADLVIESYAPGYLASIGIYQEAIRREHRKLVWVSVTGFGQDGPYASYKWSDIIGQALGGLLFLWGEPDKPPSRPRAAQGYYHASMGAALSGMVALYHARRTGRGQYVDVSMQEVLTFVLAGPGGVSGYWSLEGMNITRSGPGINLGHLISRTIYTCKEGYVAVSTMFGPHFPRLLELMKKDDAAGFLAEDPKWLNATRFAPLPTQWRCEQADADAAEGLFSKWLLRYTRDEIMQMAGEHGLMIFPVLDVPDNLTNKQLEARAYWKEVRHEDIDTTVTYPGPPVRMTATPWEMNSPAPRLGQHNDEVYAEVGLSGEQLAELKTKGVI
jgi:crotonobetainyl-CoA:carnitine CoA-transferase CaiB-like acyl-CoA transferase